ncbi:MAG TPA: phosphodiesterase [Rhizomicrobium sp.]
MDLVNVLTIAQITDLHITNASQPKDKARNEARLRTALHAISQLKPPPAAILVTGDLVDRGQPDEYEALKEILAETDIPTYFTVGNHDSRAAFREAFPDTPVDENGFIQYAFMIDDLRIVMCDTLEGKNHGGFCEKRAAWLAKTLDEAPDTPTVLALHHPPVPSGIVWMDEPENAPWLDRLACVIRGRRQIKALICGHMHRAYNGMFADQLVSVSSATSIQLALDLRPIDLRVPDGRELLTERAPGYTLLVWNSGSLALHSCPAGNFPAAVTYQVPFIKD